ncbi:MAG: DUF5105 domain-containing protein [Clostridium sp.]|nr:DUF5105 domain-containing protein [Clostridium sp.]MCM1444224.1 DUF5105 domain-containing protein [Candidatus Amulumruptor caecigallinarius]
MKKTLIIVTTFLLLFTGCSTDINNTPTKQAEEFLNKYQRLDNEVLNDLDKVIQEEEKFNSVNRDEYKELIKKQYMDMTYIIKNETIDGDKAVVEVQITVKDYIKIMNEAEEYKNNNIDLFKDELGNYSETKYIDHVIERLKETKDKVEYTIYLTVSKIDNKWTVDQINEEIEDKILGIYSY